MAKTSEWIKIKSEKDLPEQSGYYMTVCVNDQTGKRYRGLTEYYKKGYIWMTFDTVTHWCDYPDMPEE